MLDRLAPLGFDDEGIKVLVYGKSGTGKTTFIGTFPGPVLWIVCSGGLKPGELRSLNAPGVKEKITQVVLQEPEEVDTLTKHVRDTGGYQTVVVDHVTGLLDLILKKILNLSEIPVQKSWGFAAQGDYATAGQQGKELLRGLLNLSCNVALIAQERVYGEESATAEIIAPTVSAEATPSVVRWLCPACDYVVQTFIRGKMVTDTKPHPNQKGKVIKTTRRIPGVDYCLRTAPDETYMTKFRLPKGTPLPEFVVDPSYQKLMSLINGEAPR